MPEPVLKDKLTIIETVCHRPTAGGSIFVHDSRTIRTLRTFEQVYERKHLLATREWHNVDLGWIKECGLVVILNEAGFSPRPLPEEVRERISDQVLYVRLGGEAGYWIIHPGETFRGVPSHPGSIWVSTPHGRVYYTVKAFPA